MGAWLGPYLRASTRVAHRSFLLTLLEVDHHHLDLGHHRHVLPDPAVLLCVGVPGTSEASSQAIRHQGRWWVRAFAN